jgi:hypothetical protein
MKLNLAGCRFVVMTLLMVNFLGCGRTPARPSPQASSTIIVNQAGPIVIKTATAQFDILPNGYVQASLVKGGNRLTADEPEDGVAGSGDYPVSAGKDARDFALDTVHARVMDAHGKLGVRGQRVEIIGRNSDAGLEKTLAVEVYDDFPGLAISTVAYKNVGDRAFQLDQVIVNRHRLSSMLADPRSAGEMKKRFSRYATASVMSWLKLSMLADNDVRYRKMLFLEPTNTLRQSRVQNRFEVRTG